MWIPQLIKLVISASHTDFVKNIWALFTFTTSKDEGAEEIVGAGNVKRAADHYLVIALLLSYVVLAYTIHHIPLLRLVLG